jgi:hypothetical protein
MASGFTATLGLIGLVATSLPFSAASSSPALAPAGDIVQSVNRSSKGDRLPGPAADPQRSNQPKSTPVKTLQEDKHQRMEGCDPLVSPLAGSTLSQKVGRCIAGLAAPLVEG